MTKPNLNPNITITTRFGAINAELFADRAPLTVANFLHYVDEGRFDGSRFFRIVTPANEQVYEEQDADSFASIQVIQGGLPPEHPSLLPPIAHESTDQTGILHEDGVLSMSRFEPGSADGSFFICIGDQPALNYGGARYEDGQEFAAFGKITAGRDDLNAIYAQAESQEYLYNTIVIKRVSRRP